MASVFRQDTGELIGHLAEPEGPLAGGITYWPFKAWVHSDGKLCAEPEPAADKATPTATLDIPVRNQGSSDVHLIVPPELVDFIITHRAFRSESSQVLRRKRGPR